MPLACVIGRSILSTLLDVTSQCPTPCQRLHDFPSSLSPLYFWTSAFNHLPLWTLEHIAS